MESVYVLFFNDTEYIYLFDLSTKEYRVSKSPYCAERFNEREAAYFAEQLGCKYKEISIPEEFLNF